MMKDRSKDGVTERLATAECPDSAANTAEGTVVPVVREEVEVQTRRIETGSGVRIHKSVQERVQVIDEALLKDALSVERVPVDRYIEEPVGVRYEGDTMIVPILEEVLLVEKRLLLKEEVRITRQRTVHREPQRVVLRAERAEVERFGHAVGDCPAGNHQASNRAEPNEGAELDPSLIDVRRRAEEQQRNELAGR